MIYDALFMSFMDAALASLSIFLLSLSIQTFSELGRKCRCWQSR